MVLRYSACYYACCRSNALLLQILLFALGLHTPLDDSFLLLFLRARKFRSAKALSLIRSYYAVRQEHCDIFRDFTPQSVRHVFEDGTVCPLPRVLPLRPLTILVRVSKYPATHILYVEWHLCFYILPHLYKFVINLCAISVANWNVQKMSLAELFKGMLITVEHIVRVSII